MIKIELRHETREHEEHDVNINNKVFSLRIDKSPDGPVFSFRDDGISLEPHEQEHLIREMNEISRDFSSRRVWGMHVPKASTPPKKKFQKK